MDKKEEAVSKFRKPYSCAQTIYNAFAGGDADGLREIGNFSGGRAPDNMCGALYSALKIVPEEKRAALAAEFAQKAGSTRCRELKAKAHTPCADCVRIAAELIEKSESA